jgi:hypothetical protein
MSTISTIVLYIAFALIILLTVFLGIFHLWSISVTTKEAITDVRKKWLGLSPLEQKKFFLRYMFVLVMLVILFAFLWMYGHNLI